MTCFDSKGQTREIKKGKKEEKDLKLVKWQLSLRRKGDKHRHRLEQWANKLALSRAIFWQYLECRLFIYLCIYYFLMTKPVDIYKTLNRLIHTARKSRQPFEIWTNPYILKSYHLAAILWSFMTTFSLLRMFILSIHLDNYGYKNTITNVLWCIFYVKLWLYTMN